jgi:Holliday junction resolvase
MDEVSTKARLLFEAAERLGWGAEAAALVERVKGLDRGLPAEDELSAILHWLGQCRLVHRLDQGQYPPDSKSEYRVPDLLAVFEHGGGVLPALIEVKSTDKDVLSWKPQYLKSLQRYSELVKIPLLVGWKHRSFWVLFELRHFRPSVSNLKISFTEALRESLLGQLAGDFSFCFRAPVGLHLRIRKVSQTSTAWEGVIEDVYFTNAEGVRFKSPKGVLPFFVCIHQDVQLVEEESHFLQSYVISNSDQGEFAHRALVTLLDTFTKAEPPFHWRRILQQGIRPPQAGGLRDAAKKALEEGFLQYVFDLVPHSVPEWLQSEHAGQHG